MWAGGRFELPGRVTMNRQMSNVGVSKISVLPSRHFVIVLSYFIFFLKEEVKLCDTRVDCKSLLCQAFFSTGQPKIQKRKGKRSRRKKKWPGRI